MHPDDFNELTVKPEFSKGNVLWLGAGIGVDGAIPLAGWKGENSEGQITALDLSKNAIEYAQKQAAELSIGNLNCVTAGVYDLNKLSLDEAMNGIVMSGGVLQYLPSLPKLAELIFSTLKDGGRLYWRDNGPVVPEKYITLIDGPPFIATGYYGESQGQKDDPALAQQISELNKLPLIRFQYSPVTIQKAFTDLGFNVKMDIRDSLGYQRPEMERCEDGLYRYPSNHPAFGQPLSFILTAQK